MEQSGCRYARWAGLNTMKTFYMLTPPYWCFWTSLLLLNPTLVQNGSFPCPLCIPGCIPFVRRSPEYIVSNSPEVDHIRL